MISSRVCMVGALMCFVRLCNILCLTVPVDWYPIVWCDAVGVGV